MNKFNKKLVFPLVLCLMFFTTLCAYSYHADAYKGRVKYGTYHCIKDGQTCDFERYEGSTSYVGHGCPQLDRGYDRERYYEQMADFLNSGYCRFTPTKVKKYKCRYDVGYATVYVENGKVKSASSDPNMPHRDLQSFYEPDKCVERAMEGDNGEPPIKRR